MQAPFLQAEVLVDGRVVAATGRGFEAMLLPERVQKVERYSKQRPFAEAYRLSADCNDWRMGGALHPRVPCETVPQSTLLPRVVGLPTFERVEPEAVLSLGEVRDHVGDPSVLKHIARDGVGKRVMGYAVDELEIDMSGALNDLACVDTATPDASSGTVELGPRGFALYDFGIIQCGFIAVRLRCETATRVYLRFDEVREREPGRPFTLGVGAIALDLEPGEHVFESMEPYAFRFLRVLAMDAAVTVDELWLREYAHPVAAIPALFDDAELDAIFQAGRQSFRTNSVDLFTDCMSRERGGYPCDSWFTARAERALVGESRVEHNFLENYLLVDRFASIPEGMMPHCYPSDRLGKGQYIPNWALWLVRQACVHCIRTGDERLRELARPRVAALFAWFAPHRNDMGLLEDLPGWIFVEWSPANNCTEAVNHPTNMLYAQTLADAAELFDRPDWAELAETTRAAVRAESWDGTWFADQSVRVDGKLQRGEVRTETCQYHALAMGIASAETHPELWRRLRDDWGPTRGVHLAMNGADDRWRLYYDAGVEPRPDDADLAPAGLLYGLMLRFDLLQEAGEWERLIAEIRRVFAPMAEASGTIWEHVEPHSSLNHGFGSCVCEYLKNAKEQVQG